MRTVFNGIRACACLMAVGLGLSLAGGMNTTTWAQGLEAPGLTLVGDWKIQVSLSNPSSGKPRIVIVEVPPAQVLEVAGERHESLPMFNPRAGGWARGAALRGVRAQECTTRFLLDPESMVLRTGGTPDAPVWQRDVDYAIDLEWGTFGRLDKGELKAEQPVYAFYKHGLLRLDSIVLLPDGKIRLRQGEARSSGPQLPTLHDGERRLANVWLPGRMTKLEPQNLFPISESVYPEPELANPTVAEHLIPRAWTKLREGKPIRILAWGDSVTVGSYLPDPIRDRWQEQFVGRLRQKFPQARIELITEAWGGRSTASYLNEPPGSEHHYQEKVLATRPDLIVSEFVNDAGLNPDQVEERYGKLLHDFQEIGAEWIILTPHYVRPDWMGLTRERDIDEDPRPYVKGLREFAQKHQVALADASLRYGRLWRQGIPYSALMLNSINHPDARGLRIFADSLIALF